MQEDIDMNPSWKTTLASFVKPGFNQFENDKEEFNKYGAAATAGCPYLSMMNMLQ